MSDWRLVFLVVHGIGPQNRKLSDKFVCDVIETTELLLSSRFGLTKVQAGNLMSHLTTVAPDWSHLFDAPSENWLISHFIEHIDTVSMNRLAVPTWRKFLATNPTATQQQARDWLVTNLNTPKEAKEHKTELSNSIINSAITSNKKLALDSYSSITEKIKHWFFKSFPGILSIILTILLLILLFSAILGWLPCNLCAIGILTLLVVLSILVVVIKKRIDNALKLDTALYFCRELPWGALYSFGRAFEARSLSDLFIYQSKGPREQIMLHIINCINAELKNENVDKDDTLYFLPAGHSLGSVAVYDMLLGAVSAGKDGGTNKVELELLKTRILQQCLNQEQIRSTLQKECEISETVLTELKNKLSRQIKVPKSKDRLNKSKEVLKSTEHDDVEFEYQEREDFLCKAANLLRRVKPLGMITFGAPIALFFFRKPSLLKSLELWRAVCPVEFQNNKLLSWNAPNGELAWSWTNFWHPTDFVAHRLEPYFNDTTSNNTQTPISFVEDINTAKFQDPVPPHGVEAHSSYWTNQTVINKISTRIAECLIACEPKATSSSNTTAKN